MMVYSNSGSSSILVASTRSDVVIGIAKGSCPVWKKALTQGNGNSPHNLVGVGGDHMTTSGRAVFRLNPLLNRDLDQIDGSKP
jgi:hypothetical protein